MVLSSAKDYRGPVSAPASPFSEIAILWQCGFVRCVLSGDGVTCTLILQDDQRIVKTAAMPDEAMAIGVSRVWLRQQAGRRL